MNERLKQNAPEKIYIPEQEAIAASKRALARLRGDIVASKLQTDLEINTRPLGHSSRIFLEAINNPSVANVMAAQEILARNSKTIAIDGVIGRNTLTAMSNFMSQQQAETENSRNLPPLILEEPAIAPGSRNNSTQLIRWMTQTPPSPIHKTIQPLESPKSIINVIETSSTEQLPNTHINQNSRFLDPSISDRARAWVREINGAPSNTPPEKVVLPPKRVLMPPIKPRTNTQGDFPWAAIE